MKNHYHHFKKALIFVGLLSLSSAQAAVHADDQAVITAMCQSITNLNTNGGTNWDKACSGTPIGSSSNEVIPSGLILHSGDNHIKSITLNAKGLTGSLPSNIGNLGELNKLELYSNQLSGSLPTSLENLTKLKQLFLGGNQFSGALPAGLKNAPDLQEIDLNSNQLTGTIPTAWSTLTKVQRLDLYGNQLSGSLPSYLAQWQHLTRLGLARNSFSGTVPDFSQTQLCILWLQKNQFTFADILLNDAANQQRIAACPGSTQSNYAYMDQQPIDRVRTATTAKAINVNYRQHNTDNVQWYRGLVGSGTAINGATSNSYTPSAPDTYYYQVTNTTLPRLTLTSQPITVADAPTFAIGGHISGISQRVWASLQLLYGTEKEILPLNQAGVYAFQTRLPTNTSYTVEVYNQHDSISCTPAKTSGKVQQANISISITCTPKAQQQYQVKVTVNGLPKNITLPLTLNQTQPLSLTGNGNPINGIFAKTLVDNSTYRVRVKQQPVGLNCLVNNPLGGTINGTDVTVVINCTFTPGAFFSDSFEKP